MRVDIVLTLLYCLCHFKENFLNIAWAGLFREIEVRRSPTSTITPLTKLFYLLCFFWILFKKKKYIFGCIRSVLLHKGLL